MRIAPTCLALLAIASTAVTQAQTTMTAEGFTGLGITPNAKLLPWGTATFVYDNDLPGVVSQPRGHNYVTGFGLLPNLEIAGRLATSTLGSNCFTGGCGAARDLSASAKAAINVDPAGHLALAAGATDIGGAATYFRAYYGVATYSGGPLEASLGWAKRSGVGVAGSRSPLDGPFASAAWTPVSWLRAQVEYTDRNTWAGVRVFAPQAWVPQGWSAFIGANQRITDTRLTSRSWWTIGVTIPLYHLPRLPAQSRQDAPIRVAEAPAVVAPVAPQAAASQAVPAAAPPVQRPAPATRPSDEALVQLAQDLAHRGLEDIWVGRLPDDSVAVRANNGSYNWNALDALGAALGSVARTLGPSRATYRVILTQGQLPFLGVTGQADCLADWIARRPATCTAGELSTPGTMVLESLHTGAEWRVRNFHPASRTLRLRLAPVLRTHIGTEVGALDYSAGLNAGLEWAPWTGGLAEWRWDVPIARTSDYAPGGVFASARVRSGTERLTLTQSVRVPLERWLATGHDDRVRQWGLAAVTAEATVGRIGSDFDGALAALRWEPGEGRHRLSAEAGVFRNARWGEPDVFTPRRAKPLLASYRYQFAATRTNFEATAGQFMFNDRGVQLGMRQWFNDVAVSLFYRRTGLPGAATHQAVGVELSLPIGPRRDMTPSGFQITGTPRFSEAVTTTIREKANGIYPNLGVIPPARRLDDTINSDRSSLSYFEDNLERVRDAAR